MKRKIGIIDCNNFYVSCERVFNPIAVNRPVVVLSNNDGCIIARSKEIKDMGIKMGDPFFSIKDIIQTKDIQVFSSNYNLYGDMSDRVMYVIKKFSKNVEVYSIDEAFVDFTFVEEEKLHEYLKGIKEEIARLTGIPVSIGVGPNKTMAKVASAIAKKDVNSEGICVMLDPEKSKEFFPFLECDDVWGIGKRWKEKLTKIGVNNIYQFINLPDEWIRKNMTVLGLKTKYELMGLYCFLLNTKYKVRKNLSSSRSFGEDVSDFNQISEALYSYTKNLVTKLDKDNLLACKGYIYFSGNKHKKNDFFDQALISLNKPTRNVSEIWSQVYPVLVKTFDKRKKYKKCGINFTDLTFEKSLQLVMFDETFPEINPTFNLEKKWEMKKQYISKKYTSSWNELPEVYL